MNKTPKNNEYQILRYKYILPNVFSSMLLNLIFGIAWTFGLIATDASVSGSVSLATQYIFAILIAVHAILALIVTFVRSKSARMSWLTCCGSIKGKSDSYSVTSPLQDKQIGDEMAVLTDKKENIYTIDATEEHKIDELGEKNVKEDKPETKDEESAIIDSKGTGMMTEEIVISNFGADASEDEKKTEF